MLVVTFDQKYEVDAVGNVRQRLPDMGRLANRRSLGVLALGAVSVGFLAMFALARSRRAVVAGVNFDRFDRAPVLSNRIWRQLWNRRCFLCTLTARIHEFSN